MNIREELSNRLKEIAVMEGKADAMYTDLIKELKTESIKTLFDNMSKEEKEHTKVIREILEIIDKY